MLGPPERRHSQNVAFSYSASSIFSKSGRFIPTNEVSQGGPFVVGPPFRPAFRASSLRGGGPKFLKICSKNHFLSNSRCNAGPEFWSKLIQIEASSLLGPPSGQHSGQVASGEGVPNFSKFVKKIHFLSYLPGMLAQTFGSN